MAIAITSVSIQPNPVSVKATYQLSVALKETEPLPIVYRLAYTLGTKQSTIKT